MICVDRPASWLARYGQMMRDWIEFRNRSFVFAAAAIMVAVAGSAFSQTSQRPLTIAISASQTTVRVGEDVRIHVVLTNVSDQELTVGTLPNPECDYTIQVRGKEGVRVHQPDCPAVSASSRHLKPGDQIEGDVTLSKVNQNGRHGDETASAGKAFDFSLPGEYVVQLSRHASDSLKKEVIQSNKLVITVVSGYARAAGLAPPFSIKISTAHERIKVGEPVQIHIVRTNVSGQMIALPIAPETVAADASYTVSVSGPQTSMNRLGEQYEEPPLKSLKPGESIEEDGVISGHPFDFSAPGEYVIQFFQNDEDKPDYFAVKSNKLTIHVTE